MPELSTISGSTVNFAFFAAVCCTAAIVFSKRSGSGGGASSLAAATQWVEQVKTGGGADGAFVRFQALYVGVFLLMMAGDWLQGPYMYALYAAYGFSQAEIAQLFVAGFGASMVFGTFVGALADTVGRKRGALLYVAVYAASCATKHWRSYSVLMLGRLLGGIGARAFRPPPLPPSPARSRARTCPPSRAHATARAPPRSDVAPLFGL